MDYDYNIYIFGSEFVLGENNIRTPYTGTLLSSSLYVCYFDHDLAVSLRN